MAFERSIWDTIQQVAHEEGVELFDIDFPAQGRRGGVLRVYITRRAGESAPPQPPVEVGDAELEAFPTRTGVTFEDCVRVSKRILDIDEQTGLIPESCTLEVSSPGVNRRLRLPEHFSGAVGERVRVKFRDATTSVTRVVLGQLRSVTDGVGTVENEVNKEAVSFNVGEVKEARVDFKF